VRAAIVAGLARRAAVELAQLGDHGVALAQPGRAGAADSGEHGKRSGVADATG